MKTIRARLSLVIVGLALLGSVAIFGITQWLATDMIETARGREVANAKQQLAAKIDAESRQALLLASFVAGQTGVQEKFAARDRDGLAREFATAFKDMKKNFGIRQFQFHLPPATSFLRVHKVAKHGDDLSGFRKTVVETNAKKAPISGLEKGVAGVGNRGVVPVSYNGEHIGSVEFGLGFHETFVADFTAKSGYPLAILRQGESGFEAIGNKLPEGFDPQALLEETMDGGMEAAGGQYFIDRVAIPDFSGAPIAVALIAVDQTAYLAISRSAEMLGIGVSLLLLVIAGGFLLYSSRCIFVPLRTVTGQIVYLADGNTDFEVKGFNRQDEVGELARALTVCRDNKLKQTGLEDEQRASSVRREERQRRVDGLIEDFRSSSQDLLTSVETTTTGLKSTARELEEVATASAQQAQGAAGASEAASDNVQSVASAAEELASSISEISEQVSRTTTIVGKATTGAQAANHKVAGLATAASKIGEVINLIQAIAEQTNLLALNATIEAARAGEAGKGFAVVASEVKELATQTSKATEEIGAQIAAIQASTEEAVEAIGSITATMDEVDQYTGAIAAAVEEQGAATNEISSNIQGAATGTRTVVGNITELDRAVSDTNRSAESVLTATDEASATTQHLRENIDNFLKQVSAA